MAKAKSKKTKTPESKQDAAADLATRLDTLKAEAKELGYDRSEDFKTDRGDEAAAAVCWGIVDGAATARVLLIARGRLAFDGTPEELRQKGGSDGLDGAFRVLTDPDARPARKK